MCDDEDVIHYFHRTRYQNWQRSFVNSQRKRRPGARHFNPPVDTKCHSSYRPKDKPYVAG